MKSAYERALERFDVEPVKSLSDEQKARIAEIDSLYKSKIAQVELAAGQKIRQARENGDDPATVQAHLADERKSLREKCEREKDKIRNAAP